MHSIAKICADRLRAFSNNYGVNLKSSHAHELSAAFVGYKSKAAMQADIHFPLENLIQSQIFVQTPSLFIDARRKCLEDLPFDLPDTYALSEVMLTCLVLEGGFSGRFFPAWSYLAEALNTEYLQKQGNLILPPTLGLYGKARYMFNKPLYEFTPKIEATENGIELAVANKYYGSGDAYLQSIDINVTIKLQRIAGHVGFEASEVSVDILNYSPMDL